MTTGKFNLYCTLLLLSMCGKWRLCALEPSVWHHSNECDRVDQLSFAHTLTCKHECARKWTNNSFLFYRSIVWQTVLINDRNVFKIGITHTHSSTKWDKRTNSFEFFFRYQFTFVCFSKFIEFAAPNVSHRTRTDNEQRTHTLRKIHSILVCRQALVSYIVFRLFRLHLAHFSKRSITTKWPLALRVNAFVFHWYSQINFR